MIPQKKTKHKKVKKEAFLTKVIKKLQQQIVEVYKVLVKDTVNTENNWEIRQKTLALRKQKTQKKSDYVSKAIDVSVNYALKDFIKENQYEWEEKYWRFEKEYVYKIQKRSSWSNTEISKEFETKVASVLEEVIKKSSFFSYLTKQELNLANRCDFVIFWKHYSFSHVLLIECQQTYKEDQQDKRISESFKRIKKYKSSSKGKLYVFTLSIVVVGFPFSPYRVQYFGENLVLDIETFRPILERLLKEIRYYCYYSNNV